MSFQTTVISFVCFTGKKAVTTCLQSLPGDVSKPILFDHLYLHIPHSESGFKVASQLSASPEAAVIL